MQESSETLFILPSRLRAFPVSDEVDALPAATKGHALQDAKVQRESRTKLHGESHALGSPMAFSPRRAMSLCEEPNNKHDEKGLRSQSVGSIMKALNFEEIDVDGTPLSSQRSCSEFLRINSLNQKHLQFDAQGDLKSKSKKRSFLSYFGWRDSSSDRTSSSRSSAAAPPPSSASAAAAGGGGIGAQSEPVLVTQTSLTKRVQFADEDEASFLISRLRGSSRTESTSYSHSSSSSANTRFQNNSNCSSVDRPPIRFDEEPGCMDFVFGSSANASLPSSSSLRRIEANDAKKRHHFSSSSSSSSSSYNKEISRGRTAIFQESTLALDLILGIRYGGKRRLPMEIELKTLEPRTGGIRHVDSTTSFSRSLSRSSFSGLLSRSSLSGHSESGGYGSGSQHSIHSLSDLISGGAASSDHDDVGQVRMSFLEQLLSAVDQTLNKCRSVFMGPEDDAFYEQIRIQPFATGGYLRGMLVAGFASLFFNIYSLTMWPDFNTLYVVEEELMCQPHHTSAEKALYILLLLQLFFNTVQFPLRIALHLLCWESSRTVEVDAAINIIRNMLQGDLWLCNRVLGRILDALTLVMLIGGEVYLSTVQSSDALLPLLVSLCATNLLAIFVRVVMATAFALSMHDPQVLSDARRRGLSKWDLEVLPAFVFTDLKEVNNRDCSICLASFDAGEMLISLPCDRKHSFHASCIRQWLERQNSCPLCNKIV